MRMPASPEVAHTPIRGESILAWSVRVAAARTHPHVWRLLRETGLAYLAKPSAVLRSVDAARVAEVLGADADEVGRRILHPADAPGFLTLDGVRVRGADVGTQTRRFSPATLASAGTHLAIWDVRTLPFCSRSMQYLSDRCARCRTVQRWKASICVLRCDRCGSGLWMHDAEQVEAELRGPLSSVAALIDPCHPDHRDAVDRLPAELRALDRGAIFELVLAIARIVDPMLPLREPASIDPEHLSRLAGALASAWDRVVRWPDTLLGALGGRVVKGVSTRLTDMIGGGGTRTHLPEVGIALATLIDRVPAVPVKKAARMLGATVTDVAEARTSGDLDAVVVLKGGKVSLQLSWSEIQRLEKVRLDRVGRFGAGRTLRMPVYAVEELVTTCLLRTVSHPWLMDRYGEDVLTARDLREFVDALIAGSAQVVAGAAPLRMAMRGYGGGPKPYAEAVRNMLSGRWNYRAVRDPGGVLSVSIGPSEVAELWTLPHGIAREAYTMEEACDILNLKNTSAPVVRNLCSRECADGGIRIDGDALVATSARRISMAEIMSRTNLASRTTQQRLSEIGLARADDLGWCRQSVERWLQEL